MKQFTVYMAVFLMVFSTSGAYADSPIFLDRVKSAFSKSDKKQTTKKPVSLKSKTKQKSVERASEMSPGKRRALEAKQRLTNKNNLMAKRRAESQQRNAQLIAQNNIERQKAAAGVQTGTANTNVANPVSQTGQQSTKKKIIVRKRTDGEESNVPKPIFKNFR